MLLIMLIGYAHPRDTICVFDITNYGPTSGKLTTQELKDIQQLGKDFRKEFIDKQSFLPKSFNPASVYFHTDTEQPSMVSAYSFAIGAYPNDVSYLDYNNVLPSGSNLLNRQKEVRTSLGLSGSLSASQTTKVPVNTEEGYLYWKDPLHQCPIIFEDIASQFKTRTTTTQTRSSTRPSSLSRATSKIMVNDDSIVEQLMAKNLMADFENDYGSLDSYVYHAGRREPTDRTLDSVKHSHFFSDQDSYRRMLSSAGVTKGSAIKTGENTRFEVFELNGKHYVRVTRDGQAINFAGSNNGVIELNAFLTTVYPKLYIGGTQDVCVGQDDGQGNIIPNCARGSFVGTQRVIQTVQPIQTVQTYQTVQTVAAQPVVTEKCHTEERTVARAEPTREHKVDLINVGYTEIVQIPRPRVVREEVVVERPVEIVRNVPVEVRVPVVEEKVVVHEVEKIVAEPPTHIHHVTLETPDNPVGLPPIQFHEEIDEGWPWWLWLLPLLCCIPLLAWLLCRKPKPKPVVRPKQPMAPVAAKALTKPKEREIMEVKTVERHSPERKYVIERKVVDEGEAIEMEIERELKKSRAVRETHASRAVSHGRQTAAEIAGEGALARTTGQGRTRRIKTIKKFGQVIGKEEQILDADGNIISTQKIGLDEAEYGSDVHMKSAAGSEYARESRYADDLAAPTSSQLAYERRSRRGYSSGRHQDNYGNIDGVRTGNFAEGTALGSGAGNQYEVRSGGSGALGSANIGGGSHQYEVRSGGSGALGSANIGGAGYQYESRGGDADYGRYSPGRVSRGSRGSRGSPVGSGRHRQDYQIQDDIGGDRYYV